MLPQCIEFSFYGIGIKMEKMKKRRVIAFLGVFAVLAICFFLIWGKDLFFERSDNLARQRGVKATCDSVETEELSADKAIDGDDENLSSRWSSENNREDASHYIELEFPEEISVSFVVLKWERTNVISYQLESSLDGQNWTTLQSFAQAPSSKRQEIALEEAADVKYLRLSTNAVSTEEEDFSNYYQNVSLFEFEVYEHLPVSYQIEAPEIVKREDGSRYLQMPEVPDGYRITYIGADYEQIVGADGEIYATLQEKEVTVGYRLEKEDGKEDTVEVSFVISVPAADEALASFLAEDEAFSSFLAEDETLAAFLAKEVTTQNEKPKVVPALAEWFGGAGNFVPDENSRIVIAQESLYQTANRFADWYAKIMGYEIPVVREDDTKVQPGDFYLCKGLDNEGTENEGADNSEGDNELTDGDKSDSYLKGLGKEGYFCEISDICVISGEQEQGIYWGTISVLQMLREQNGILPQGLVRDYPKYEVRGFGIDVARKPVSMAMLYQIMETMSWYKMNDLGIHLNDNEILSTSGLTNSPQEAMTAYSAFRIDTSVTNEKGEALTSSDYAYSTEEFAALIETAKTYGVSIVPEIDTPAHSLSFTKLFPEYALTVRNEAVDQIDLSNPEAIEIIQDIWQEVLGGKEQKASKEEEQALNGQDAAKQAAFAGADTVNIGMDEYYGDGETYRQYMQEMIAYIKELDKDKTIRLWGSLSNMEGTTMPPVENVQMNLWSDIWADPVEMYEAGYSLINMQNNHLYLIPGGGYDYLDVEELYDNWEPNKFYDHKKTEIIPAYSPQMLGAAYMIWNDMCGTLDVGISEYDLFDRFYKPLPVISSKLWGEETTENSYEKWMEEAQAIGKAPENENDNSVMLEGDYRVSMQVYRQPAAYNMTQGKPIEQILTEADSAYGQTAFKAVQKETGQVGFSREGRDYSFDYTLPEGEWVTLTIEGTLHQTRLYVNGELVDTLGDDEPFTEYATFAFPLQRIAPETNGFCGEIRQITVEETP